MAPPRPKSPSRIEVWRHEVSACVPPSPPVVVKQPSFWKKILGSSSKRSKSSAVPSLEVSGVKGKDGEESVKTEMYSSTGSREAEDKRVKGNGADDGSSMDLEGSDGGVGGLLREKAERLERARQLLERGAGKGTEATK